MDLTAYTYGVMSWLAIHIKLVREGSMFDPTKAHC